MNNKKVRLLVEGVEKVNRILNDIGATKEVLEKEAKSFGNSSHVVLPKKHLNKKVKIIIG